MKAPAISSCYVFHMWKNIITVKWEHHQRFGLLQGNWICPFAFNTDISGDHFAFGKHDRIFLTRIFTWINRTQGRTRFTGSRIYSGTFGIHVWLIFACTCIIRFRRKSTFMVYLFCQICTMWQFIANTSQRPIGSHWDEQISSACTNCFGKLGKRVRKPRRIVQLIKFVKTKFLHNLCT